jgi:hypothetical protein
VSYEAEDGYKMAASPVPGNSQYRWKGGLGALCDAVQCSISWSSFLVFGARDVGLWYHFMIDMHVWKDTRLGLDTERFCDVMSLLLCQYSHCQRAVRSTRRDGCYACFRGPLMETTVRMRLGLPQWQSVRSRCIVDALRAPHLACPHWNLKTMSVASLTHLGEDV